MTKDELIQRFDDAIAALENDGWTQGSMTMSAATLERLSRLRKLGIIDRSPQPVVLGPAGSHCVLGAFGEVRMDEHLRDWYAICEAIVAFGGITVNRDDPTIDDKVDQVMLWNDTRGRTGDEVIAALKRTRSVLQLKEETHVS